MRHIFVFVLFLFFVCLFVCLVFFVFFLGGGGAVGPIFRATGIVLGILFQYFSNFRGTVSKFQRHTPSKKVKVTPGLLVFL